MAARFIFLTIMLSAAASPSPGQPASQTVTVAHARHAAVPGLGRQFPPVVQRTGKPPTGYQVTFRYWAPAPLACVSRASGISPAPAGPPSPAPKGSCPPSGVRTTSRVLTDVRFQRSENSGTGHVQAPAVPTTTSIGLRASRRYRLRRPFARGPPLRRQRPGVVERADAEAPLPAHRRGESHRGGRRDAHPAARTPSCLLATELSGVTSTFSRSAGTPGPGTLPPNWKSPSATFDNCFI